MCSQGISDQLLSHINDDLEVRTTSYVHRRAILHFPFLTIV